MWCKKLEKDTFSNAAVVAESKKFIWVVINRDHTPELVKKFNVSAFPSLIVLGKNQEKVYRFQSYKLPPEFMADLAHGLRRYGLYTSGQEWDTPDPRLDTISSAGTVEMMKAPSAAVPAGMEFLKGDFWVAQVGTLFRLDPASGAVRQKFALNPAIQDLCTDGKLLYAIDSGWTAGKPIYVIDPENGKIVREIVTEENKKNKSYGAKGIAWAGGKLYALSGMEGRIDEVDPATGTVVGTIQSPEKWITSLDFDGANFVTGSRTDLIVLSRKGAVVKKVPMHYPLRSVACHEGAFYLMEQPIFGFDKENKSVQIWPKETLVYKLTLQ